MSARGNPCGGFCFLRTLPNAFQVLVSRRLFILLVTKNTNETQSTNHPLNLTKYRNPVIMEIRSVSSFKGSSWTAEWG